MQEACNSNLEILTMLTTDGLVKVADAAGITEQNAGGYGLLQNVPNPFSASTDIIFTLPEPARATISVYDVYGKKLAEIKGDYQAGRNTVPWDGRDFNGQKLSDGAYYYRLQSGNYSAIRKMVLIK
jgi:flagellar hook assembly protein FlgD